MEHENHKQKLNDTSINISTALKVLKETKCQILRTGNKQVKHIFYICICDTDQKEPICKDCIDNCHRGHTIITTFEEEAICHCGLNLHERKNFELEKNEFSRKCYFSEWATISKIDLFYKHPQSGITICAFCYNFCMEENANIYSKKTTENIVNTETNNDLSESKNIQACECSHEDHKKISKILKKISDMFYFKSDINEFKKIKLTIISTNEKLNLYNTNHNPNANILKEGQALSGNQSNIYQNGELIDDNKNSNKTGSMITNSQHRYKEKYLESLLLKYENFGGLNVLQTINLILNSSRTYKNYFYPFESYLILIKENFDMDNFEIDNQIGFTNFMLGLTALRNMADSLKGFYGVNYTFEEILSEAFLFRIYDKKFEYKNMKIWLLKNNLIYLYYKFIFKREFSRFPKMSIYHFYNLHPLQHLLFLSNSNSQEFEIIRNKYMKNQNFLNGCLRKISRIILIKEINFHKFEIILTTYKMLNYLAHWNIFTHENITNYCNVNEELFFKLEESLRDLHHGTVPPSGIFETKNISSKNKLLIINLILKIMTKILKSFIYMIFNLNNDIIYKALKNNKASMDDLEKFNFFILNPELGRNINKNIINIMNFTRTLKNVKSKQMEKLINLTYQIHTCSFEYPDNYTISIRRLLDKNKEIYLNLIKSDFQYGIHSNLQLEEIEFVKYINAETFKLQESLNKFNTMELNYEDFLNEFAETLKNFMNKMGIVNKEIPEVDFNFENLEFENNKERDYKDENYYIEKKAAEKKFKIYQKPLSIFAGFEPLNCQAEFQAEKNSLMYLLKLKVLMNKSFYIPTLIKGFKLVMLNELNKKREANVFINQNIFVGVIRILYFYVEDNLDNCFEILNSNIFGIIKYIDMAQVNLIINLITFTLVKLRNNNAEFASPKEIIKICKFIHRKVMTQQDNLTIMLKFVNILNLVTDFPHMNQLYVYDRVRKVLKDFYAENKILPFFKTYLLSLTKSHLADLSNRNEEILTGDRKSLLNSVVMFNNKDSLTNQHQSQISKNLNINYQKSNTQNSYVAFNHNFLNLNINLSNPTDLEQTMIIYTLSLKLVNFLFDGNATMNEEKFLFSILSQSEIQQILSKKDLNLKLRVEILKFFRIIYIDVIIDHKKLKIYRSTIINSIGDKDDDSFDDSLRYDFFNNLIGINSQLLNLSFESYIIKFELRYFDEIMNFFPVKKRNNTILLDYFENGILMPLYIFLDKFMSIILDLKGTEYLNLYEIVIYFLRMKRFLVDKFIKSKDEDEAKITGNFFKRLISGKTNKVKQLFKVTNKEYTISQINSDLDILKKKDFELFNYKLIYSIFQNHFDDFIISNYAKSIMNFFKKKDVVYTPEKIDKTKKILKKLEMLDSNFENNIFNLIIKYENDKTNFQNCIFLSCLDEHNLEFHCNYRYLLIRSIFYLINDKTYCQIYRKKILVVLLKLLQYQTVPIQKEIYSIYESSKESINLNFLMDLFFENFLSIIFSSCNPSSVSSNEDYFISLLIIKIFKYLCEEHYQDFQKVFFMKLKFDYYPKSELEKLKSDSNYYSAYSEKIGANQDRSIKINYKSSENSNKEEENGLNNKDKNLIVSLPTDKQVTLFEFMLCILGKILILSKWNKINFTNIKDNSSSDFFSDIFFAIIELLIEMIQGTDQENLNNIKLEARGHNNQFYVFLTLSKNLVYHEDHNSSIVNNSRKNIMEFLIAFLEEKSTPKKLVQLISTVYNPYSILEALIKIMKKIFITIYPNYVDKQDNYIRFYQFLFFNKEMRDYFLNTYFNDTEFCMKEEFELANKMFQFVKLLCSKYRNEEAIILFNSISNEEILEKKIKKKIFNMNKNKSSNIVQNPNEDNKSSQLYNNLNNSISNLQPLHNHPNINTNNILSSINHQQNPAYVNNNEKEISLNTEILMQDKFFQMFNLDRSNETLDYEIINVLQFFEKITRSVLVQNGNEETLVLFTINPSIPYLSNNTKQDFYENVNRESRYTKLYSLMEYCDYFQMEINYNFERSKTDFLFHYFNKINYFLLEFLFFFLLLLINILMFAKYDNQHLGSDQEQKLSDVVFILGLINVIFNAIIIVIWLYTKFSLYYKIELKKFALKNKIDSNNDIKNFDRYFNIPIIDTIIKKNEINAFISNMILSAIAVSNKGNHFVFAIQTFIIINLSVVLKNLIKSILLKYKQLLACIFSLLVLSYFFASISFFFMSGDYLDTLQTNQENKCGSYLYCLLTTLTFGIRTDGGIARWLVPVPYIENDSTLHYVGRYFYEVMFYLVLIVILLNIIFGIIIDTFAELSEEQHEIDHDKHEKCFICGDRKENLEKKSIGFSKHVEIDHSIWNYVDYLITLKYVDPQETNAINSYVIDMVSQKNISWFPSSKKDGEEGEETEEE